MPGSVNSTFRVWRSTTVTVSSRRPPAPSRDSDAYARYRPSGEIRAYANTPSVGCREYTRSRRGAGDDGAVTEQATRTGSRTRSFMTVSGRIGEDFTPRYTQSARGRCPEGPAPTPARHSARAP